MTNPTTSTTDERSPSDDAPDEVDPDTGEVIADADLPETPEDLPIRPASELKPEEENDGTSSLLGQVRTGVFEDVPMEQYHAHPAVSRSMLAEYAECDEYLRHRLQERTVWEPSRDEESSDALSTGRAAHLKLLEPKKAETTFRMAPDRCEAETNSGDRCSNSPKALFEGEDGTERFLCGTHARGLDEHPDLDMMTRSRAETVEGICAAARADDQIRQYLQQPGRAELSVVTTTKRGLPLRARPDWLTADPDRGTWTILDLKTCSDAHPKAVERAISRHGLWLQAILYPMVVQQEIGVWPEFLFAFVEKEPPHATQVYRIGPEDRAGIRHRTRELISEVSEKLWTGHWTGYDVSAHTDTVRRVSMKPWDKAKLGIPDVEV